MNYPIYKRSRLIKYKTYVMITSEKECIEVCEDEHRIQIHSDGVMSEHFLTNNGYEDSSASEFQSKYAEMRKHTTEKITAPELLRLQRTEQLIAS